MNEFTVHCGCGRKMALDSLRGRGAYRCGCGARVRVLNPVTYEGPSCIAAAKEGRCQYRAVRGSCEEEAALSLCMSHLKAHRQVLKAVLDCRAALASLLMQRRSDNRGRYAGLREAYRDQAVIYYARVGDLVKIGTTVNMKNRMRSLRPDEILATEPGYFDLESERLDQFAHLKSHGREWFHPGPDLMRYVAAVRERYGPPTMTGALGWATPAHADDEAAELPAPAPDGRVYVSGRQAAQLLGLSARVFRQWCEFGWLAEAAQEQGGRHLLLFRLDDVLAADRRARVSAA